LRSSIIVSALRDVHRIQYLDIKIKYRRPAVKPHRGRQRRLEWNGGRATETGEMELKLERCLVRNWREGDQASLVEHADDRRVWLNLRDRFPHPYTRRHADEWVREANLCEPVTHFAIEVADAAVGGIGLQVGGDVYRRSAEIGYWLGERYWGRGIASEAVPAVTEYGFRELGLCRIWAGIFEWNHASMRVLEKAGYVLEGRLRKAVLKDGRFTDEYRYAIVR
jgi:RimJ/RimL family protein N-acetyltransferase